MVVFDDAGVKRSKLGGILMGRNSAVPDTYGLSAEELAHIMSRWRERALR
jgi:hypothetical protein